MTMLDQASYENQEQAKAYKKATHRPDISVEKGGRTIREFNKADMQR